MHLFEIHFILVGISLIKVVDFTRLNPVDSVGFVRLVKIEALVRESGLHQLFRVSLRESNFKPFYSSGITRKVNLKM